ncbi:MAG: hypothetical protein KKA67_11865 [Spirochaetes bacterium]|nr:hypothetical protein [Spirochaetota bacterium]MBU1081428.1 hypothetical protein [Spirochaetota bacterium]
MTARFPIAVAALALAFALPAAAQDSLSFSEDDLFGSEDDVVETVTVSAEGSAVKSLLQADSVRVGGSFAGRATASFDWNDPWAGDFDLAAPDSYGLAPALSALIFFDGRPTESSRFYGSVKTSWPFAAPKTVLTGATYLPSVPIVRPDPSVATTTTTLSLPNIEVFELFSDFSWNDSLYFRFGKQTINWGVGYFFSPANIMNLEAIDPLDPTAQLEGPVALRAHFPIPGTQHNLWGYAVFDSEDMKPEETALAAKAEFVFGGWELGVGGYYKKDDPLRGMLTAVGSVGQVRLFGEATLQLGTSRTWVTEVSPALAATRFVTTTDTADFDGTPFFKGTAGLSYTNSDAHITVMGQYLFDQEGYANADRDARIAEARDSEDAIKALLGDDALYSLFLKGLILNSGRHYAAVTFSKSELLLDDLSFSLVAMGNLSDFSAYLKPSLSYAFFDGMSLSLSAAFAIGFDDGEYVVLNDGRAMGLTAALTLGTGAF